MIVIKNRALFWKVSSKITYQATGAEDAAGLNTCIR
jgi:hypothetical protein